MSRDLSTFRTVTQHAVPDTDRKDVTAAKFAENMFDVANEAKLAADSSQAQLDLNELDNQYRINNQSDPFNKEAQKQYRERRKEMFNGYISNMNPFYRDEWLATSKNLADKSDLNNQTWGFKQTQNNTVNSINTSIKNNLEAAGASGRKYGSGAENDLNSMLNFLPGRQQLSTFAQKNLGDETANQMLETYDEDYMKSFVSGVAENNPVKALALLENDRVKEAVGDSATFNSFKKAVENKSLKFQTAAIQNEIINTLQEEVVAFKSGEPLSYAQAQAVTENMSEPAKQYFMKANGFADPAKRKLDNAEKLQLRADIVENIVNFTSQDEMKLGDAGKLQDQVFQAMNSGAFSRKEGTELISQIIEPTLEGRRELIKPGVWDSGDWNPFREDVGVSVIEDFYDDKVRIKSPEEREATFGGAFVDEEDVDPVVRMRNNQNKVKLYDSYFNALKREASVYVTSDFPNGQVIGTIDKIGDSAVRRGIYRRAADAAMTEFKSGVAPVEIKNTIPQEAIKELLQTPDTADAFDEMFGTGAANRILGQ
ncbi:MAG: hypothetical protein V3U75_13330 [Methylococcaceae bacterium]